MWGNIRTYTQACIHSVFWLEGTWLSSMSKEDSGLKSWIITRSFWKYRSPWRKSQTLSSHLLSLPHRVLAGDFSRPAALLPTSSGSLHTNLGSQLKTSTTTIPSLTSLKQFRVPRGTRGPCTSEKRDFQLVEGIASKKVQSRGLGCRSWAEPRLLPTASEPEHWLLQSLTHGLVQRGPSNPCGAPAPQGTAPNQGQMGAVSSSPLVSSAHQADEDGEQPVGDKWREEKECQTLYPRASALI